MRWKRPAPPRQVGTAAFLEAIRTRELEHVAPRLGAPCRLLEIGAGTGVQARALHARGFDVTAIEVASSNYAAQRVFPITDYDGATLPFPDASFDLVYSSNVLEHVAELDGLQQEMRRVLRPGGRCVHVLPSGTWRLWTNVTYLMLVGSFVVRARRLPLIPPRHGEHGNAFTEIATFGPRAWRRRFEASGFDVDAVEPLPLFYTGQGALDAALSLEARSALARVLGPACYLYEVHPRIPGA